MTARDNAETADLTLEVGSLREQLKESESKCRALTVESEGWARQLTEATALLVRVRTAVRDAVNHRNWGDVLKAISERAPAQPAAPEPSADTENPDYCRGYTDGVNDGVREILASKERDDRLAAAVADVTKNLDWHARAESAEAQLAAVLNERQELLAALQLQQNTSLAMADTLTESKALLRAFWNGADPIRHGRVVFEWFKSYGENLNALTPAPSPGAGEWTKPEQGPFSDIDLSKCIDPTIPDGYVRIDGKLVPSPGADPGRSGK